MRGMLKGAESRAEERGREFNLDLDYIVSLYVEVCPILGIDLVWDNTGQIVHGSPSLDRVNNLKGYIKGNVQIVSHRANSLKRDYLLVEWEKIKRYMESGGGFVTIEDEHFKDPVSKVLTAEVILEMRKARRQGESAEEIAWGCNVPLGLVGRYLRHFEVDFL